MEAVDGMVRQVVVPNSHKAAQDLQLGSQDVRALIWLGRRERCLMSDFAKGVRVPPSTATHLANRLVEKGVMIRERMEQDRRVVSIKSQPAPPRKGWHRLRDEVHQMGRTWVSSGE